jgi:hypothetical protein
MHSLYTLYSERDMASAHFAPPTHACEQISSGVIRDDASNSHAKSAILFFE